MEVYLNEKIKERSIYVNNTEIKISYDGESDLTLSFLYREDDRLDQVEKHVKIVPKSLVTIYRRHYSMPKVSVMSHPKNNNDIVMWLCGFNKDQRYYDLESAKRAAMEFSSKKGVSLITSDIYYNNDDVFKIFITEDHGYTENVCMYMLDTFIGNDVVNAIVFYSRMGGRIKFPKDYVLKTLKEIGLTDAEAKKAVILSSLR